MCVCVCVCVLNILSIYVYMFKCHLGDCVSYENNTYVGLTTTTLSRRLTMHLNNSIGLYLKIHSIPRSKFQKILVENISIIAHEINKLRLEILEALHTKTQTPRINRINLENNEFFD